MEILPLDPTFLTKAAALFGAKFRGLRQAVACVPDRLQESQPVIERLAHLIDHFPAFMALDGDRLVGYLAAWLVDDFRNTGRKAAYSPEWGHAVSTGQEHLIYKALYRRAADHWAESGCQVHVITLLANDNLAGKNWFWNGFGLIVVDAVRPTGPLGISPSSPFRFFKAAIDDIPILCLLDDEHRSHYTRSPVFMAPRPGWNADQAGAFLSKPHNSVWLAMDGSAPAGFICFNAMQPDSLDILDAESIIKISGAYVRPAYRGRGIATQLLNLALQDYAHQGFTCCAVDFESANPEAAAFWPRYFEAVCYSLMRVPEYLP